ncbi:MAG: HNH endonuclease [Candidatus Pristimantibacillus lignocellulolyticus]|uniref:Putative HNH nuclease YajD n=1 Tax=Candidatus Pristimantibacillus lignocellulolyticus TaxID=2994561 RepID=A0A9J6ZFL2_9BACL|nr:MAG: HNH endonuclease [Candidatus Pristimantibacillus lignocellulolyticus]
MAKIWAKKVDPFYKSTAWLKCRAYVLLRDNYLCQTCLRDQALTPANTVHHIKARLDYPDLALDTDNLESICPSCHNKEHPEKGGGQKKDARKKRRVNVVVSKANEEWW